MQQVSLAQQPIPIPPVNQFWRVNTLLLPSMPDMEALLLDPDNNDGEILIRQSYVQYLQSIQDIRFRGRKTPSNKIFTGPAGAGKSFTLYALAQYAQQCGFMILYLPNCSALSLYSPKMLASYILHNIKTYNPNWPYGGLDVDNASEDRILELASKAVEEIKMGSIYPGGLFLDQWNCVLNPQTNQYFHHLFGTFSRTSVIYGVSYVAVSPSFPFPHHLFADATAITARVEIRLYNDLEFEAVFNRFVSLGRLPSNAREEITHLCGRVGRIYYFAQLVWRHSTDHSAWLAEHSHQTILAAENYYVHHVQSLISENVPTNEVQKRTLAIFSAKMFLNKYTANHLQNMPEAIRWVGLYDSTCSPPVPVCPAVTTAIFRLLPSLLVTLTNCRGTIDIALQLFVESGIRGSILPTVLKLPCTDLEGTEKDLMEWSIKKIVVQDPSNPVECLENMEDGTLIICSERLQAVADMILYQSSVMYFIKISMSTYTQNRTKIEDLVASTIVVNGKSMSIGEFYTSMAPKSWNMPILKKRFNIKDMERVKYVYCTPDTKSHRLAINSPAKNVYRVGGENLSVFGHDYSLFL